MFTIGVIWLLLKVAVWVLGMTGVALLVASALKVARVRWTLPADMLDELELIKRGEANNAEQVRILKQMKKDMDARQVDPFTPNGDPHKNGTNGDDNS